MSQPLRLLVNPQAARGRKLLRKRNVIARAGLELVVTRDAEDMTAQARAAAEQGMNRVLVCGGDGSLHHAIQGLAGSDCALGVLPGGSGNDLARALGLEFDLLRALDAAVTGTTRRIDLGRVEGRHFAGAAGLGFDGDVAAFVASRASRRSGRWIYPWAVLRTLPAFDPPHLRIEYDGAVWEGRVMLAALANSPFFGGGMRIAPAASLTDGYLHLIIVRAVPKLDLVALFHRVYRGTHVDHPAVSSFRVRRATIRADHELWLYADGERLFPLSPDGSTIEAAAAGLAVVH